MKVGLLGGSFNPAHRGHRNLSLHARTALGLDEVWWVVSPGNPLKAAVGMAPYSARLAAAHRVARAAPIRVSDFEARAGTRYTLHTVQALQHRYPNHRFIWLVGADIPSEFHRWRGWRRLAHLVPIAVALRPGYAGLAARSPGAAWLRRFVRPAASADWTRWSLPAVVPLALPPDPTSATALRRADPDWHSAHSLPMSKSPELPA